MADNIMKLEDRELINLTLQGKSECFDVLIKRHEPAVRKRVRKMVRNESDEDDLVQETLMKAWRHLPNFRSEASFRTWITRIAWNEVLQFYRGGLYWRFCAVDVDGFASDSKSPHQAAELAETTQNVHKAIQRLPQIYRQTLILRDIKELSEAETVRSLRTTIPAVKSRLFRARQMLSTALRVRNPIGSQISNRAA